MMFPLADLDDVGAGALAEADAELLPIGSTVGAVGELCGEPPHPASSSAATGRVSSAFFNCCPQYVRFERVRLTVSQGYDIYVSASVTDK